MGDQEKKSSNRKGLAIVVVLILAALATGVGFFYYKHQRLPTFSDVSSLWN